MEEQSGKMSTIAIDGSDGKVNATIKYAELEKENKKLNIQIKQKDKTYEVLLRDKENLQKEYNKSVLIRDKLEQVCREQQKLIKSVKNESMTKIKQAEENRKENQARFQVAINEINQTLSKNNEENIKLREDNISIAKKLKYLSEQYHEREKQIENINEKVLVETRLNEAKLAKAQMEAVAEKEILLRDKKKILDELLTSKKSIEEMRHCEEVMKEQLNFYAEKYSDFRNLLEKNHGTFETYNTEIDKMSKKMKRLEKDGLEWKRKWEESNAKLILLAAEKQGREDYTGKCAKQVQQLQKLLRTLQAERKILYQLLKENNIERPPLPVVEDDVELLKEVARPNANSAKIETMAKSCADLKEALAKLQGQMNAITTTTTNTNDQKQVEVPKSKNKKSRHRNKACPSKERGKIRLIENASVEEKICSNSINMNNSLIQNESVNLEEVPNTNNIEEIKNNVLQNQPTTTELNNELSAKVVNNSVLKHNENDIDKENCIDEIKELTDVNLENNVSNQELPTILSGP